MPSANGHLDYHEETGEDFYNYAFKVMLVGDSCVGKTCLLIRFKDNAFLHNNFIATVGMDYRNKTLNLDGVKIKLQIWDTAGQERFRSLTHTYYRDADAILLVFDLSNRSTFDHVKDSFYTPLSYLVVILYRLSAVRPTKACRLVPYYCDLTSKLRMGTIPFCSTLHIFDEKRNGPHPQFRSIVHLARACRLIPYLSDLQSWLGDVKEYAKNDILIYLVGNKADLVSQRQVKTEEAKKLAEDCGLPFAETSGKTGMNVEHVFRTIGHELSKRKAGKVVTEKGIELGIADEAQLTKQGCTSC